MQFYANECNEGETLTPNPNECNSTLTSGTNGCAAPTYTIYTRGGGQVRNVGSEFKYGQLSPMLQYMLLKVQSDEFISATLIVAASTHGYTCNNHFNLKKCSRVACESRNVSHVANSDIYKCF